jgi:leucyl-tRNA synthetase
MAVSDGHKMSKSKGNAVSPDDYDPDELRLYLMFIGHYFDGGVWSDQNIRGVRRFLRRFCEWAGGDGDGDGGQPDVDALREECFAYARSFKFNKVVSTLMTFLNRHGSVRLSAASREHLSDTVRVFAPGIDGKINSFRRR